MGNKIKGKDQVNPPQNQLPYQEIQQQDAPLSYYQSEQSLVQQINLPSLDSIPDQNQPISPRLSQQNPVLQFHSVSDNQFLQDKYRMLITEPYIRQNHFPQMPLQQLDEVIHQFTVNFPYCNQFIVQHLKIRLEQISSDYGLSDLSINCNNVQFSGTKYQFEQRYQVSWRIYEEIVSMYIQTNHLQILIYTFNVIPEGLHQIFDQMIGLIEENELEFSDIYLSEEKCSITIEIPAKYLSNYRIVCKEYEYNFKNLEFNDEQQYQPIYPLEWIPQQQNTLKVASSDVEYQKISDLFQATNPNRRIHAILRIQNKIVWDNYIKEKDKLKRFYKAKGIELFAEELQLYAWHCFDGYHLSNHYNRMGLYREYNQNEQDMRESQGEWGQAYYFSKAAADSWARSYPLRDNDNIKFSKKVITCCLLTTGRIKLCNPNSLEKPPNDFDCVGGLNGETSLYMLYGQGALRAYPAYEVIYE